MPVLTVNLSPEYKIHIGAGLLHRAGGLFDLDRRVLIVTDDGVPEEYAKTVAACAKRAKIVTLPQGEATKNMDSFTLLLREMLDGGFTRQDCVVAVGGGVVGDLAGFAAACYMRGIDFYNVPTTLLSQVDSSVGGKTGIDFGGVKNSVGAFCQPKGVIADTDTLRTLAPRQVSDGLAEALKMAVTSDSELFAEFENGIPDIEWLVIRAVSIKKSVVERDERECGLRRVLNFGHTLGHGIESLGLGLSHGECVALGMLPMCAPTLRKRLIPIYERLGLPVSLDFDRDKVLAAVLHDKKAVSDGITAVFSDAPGSFRFETLTAEGIRLLLERVRYFL